MDASGFEGDVEEPIVASVIPNKTWEWRSLEVRKVFGAFDRHSGDNQSK